MDREPLNLPTPVLIVISVSSIILLLYLSLYAISQKPKPPKDQETPYYAEDTYNPGTASTEFLAHPATETTSQERQVRDISQSDYDRMNQETQDQLRRLKTDRDLSKTQRSLQTF